MSKKTTRHIINFQFPTTLNSLSFLHLRIKLLKKEKIIKNKRKEKRTKKFRDTIEFNSFFLSTYTYFFPNLQQNSEPKFIITSPEQADGKESIPGRDGRDWKVPFHSSLSSPFSFFDRKTPIETRAEFKFQRTSDIGLSRGGID